MTPRTSTSRSMRCEEYNLANEVVVVRDGAEALDYLYARGQATGRAPGRTLPWCCST